ncbi:YeeE/YedE family protein [Vibrio mangrovi]|uniref:YeeE/YedE thiosulfate transporter family protein n=1 Tax=Vibrio mangrovi TaxID=474394 RepID=A0A1Y6IUX9_9VIBR|nr:YeeE/YedE thiosulfate transporter family protein [Vibrio mangrovi]MDW6004523.1 YeeE/YedE thiosulfate transporter family protein [Vibrio mangrovi]SMS00811.1 hypothetical protein VIM7927_02082 [Vibrio mangrovi]
MWSNIPWLSFFGGLLVGLSALLLLVFNGRIAGISGVLSGVILPRHRESLWKIFFAIGMVAGGAVAAYSLGFAVPQQLNLSVWQLAVAGLLVGIGTRIANGCTSGHGICGLGRLSPRSVVATGVFMLVAVVTVWVRFHL